MKIMCEMFCEKRNIVRNSYLKGLACIVCMVFIDVVIKMFIDNYFMETKYLFAGKFGFNPFINRDQLTIFNRELNMNFEMGVLIFINVASIAMLMFLMFILRKDKNVLSVVYFGGWIELSGMICSLIDKLFWHGSLDYVQCFSIVFDLKDVYLYVGASIICVGIIASAIQERKKKAKE